MHKSLIITALIAAAILSGCNKSSSPAPAASPAAPPPKDALEERLRKLSGNDAKNCGRMDQTADFKAGGDCAMQAAQSKKPFYVAYDMPGLSVGIAGNSEGKLNTVQAETGQAQGAQAKVTEFACPSELRVAQSGRITCTPVGAGMGGAMGAGGSNPHGGAGGGESSHGGGMMAAPPGTPNPHGAVPTTPGTANPHGGSDSKPPVKRPPAT